MLLNRHLQIPCIAIGKKTLWLTMNQPMPGVVDSAFGALLLISRNGFSTKLQYQYYQYFSTNFSTNGSTNFSTAFRLRNFIFFFFSFFYFFFVIFYCIFQTYFSILSPVSLTSPLPDRAPSAPDKRERPFCFALDH